MSVPLTVYDHIAQNNRRTFWLVLLFPVSLSVLVGLACLGAVYFISDPAFTHDGILLLVNIFPRMANVLDENNYMFWSAMGYLIYALIPIFLAAFLWMGISYLFGDRMMLGFARAQPLEPGEAPQVYRAVENVSIAAGLPMPKVYIIDDDSLNAFATGRDPQTASIALTTGIINKLEPLELEGVIAHEMAHIGNRDIRLNLLIITGLGIFGFVADYLRIFAYGRSRSNEKAGQLQLLIFLIVIALLVFNFVVAPIIRFAVSRTREYAADATGALITRNPQALASALKKISGDARVEILDEQPKMAVACIANPKMELNNEGREKTGLFDTHPSIESRIRRLQRMG